MRNIVNNIDSDNKVLLKNISGSFVIKGLSLIVAFFSTPLFIKYFNDNDVLGVWYTLLSILTWVFSFDLGIGNGIRNHLTKAIVQKDFQKVREVISSGLYAITIVSIIFTLIGWFILAKLNLNQILGISEDLVSYNILYKSSLMIFAAIMLRFELSFIGSIYYALQRSMINNLIALGVSVLQLVYVLFFHFDNSEIALINISYAYLIISNLPILIAGVIVFFKDLKGCHPAYRCVSRTSMVSILNIGGIFFICQILAMLIANSNEFFISNIFGSKFAADYSFYYKLNSVLPFIFIMAMAPVWSMVTKKQEEKNFIWILKNLNRLTIALGILLSLQLVILPFTQFIMNAWLGKGILDVNIADNSSLVLFCFLWAYNAMLSSIVCGLARMKVQMLSYSLSFIVKVVIVYSLYRWFNHWSLVVWSNVLILLPYCIIQHIDILRYLKKNIKSQTLLNQIV